MYGYQLREVAKEEMTRAHSRVLEKLVAKASDVMQFRAVIDEQHVLQVVYLMQINRTVSKSKEVVYNVEDAVGYPKVMCTDVP
ncbi:hypothetical protein SPFM10_00176 [Salmonella phage SPFM10]|nr:hypothetical protein SPFM10_00176 [Salmonella phage SPFM10]